jgi:hypothetical protein
MMTGVYWFVAGIAATLIVQLLGVYFLTVVIPKGESNGREPTSLPDQTVQPEKSENTEPDSSDNDLGSD